MEIDILQLAAGALCFAQKDRPLQAVDNRALSNPRWDDPKPPKREQAPGRQRQLRNTALYRIAVGSEDGIEVRNILGAVANETGLRSRFIGQIRIYPKYSTIELPDDLPRKMIEHLKKVYVGKKQMKISRSRGDDPVGGDRRKSRDVKPKSAKGKRKPRKSGKPKAKS